MKRKIPNIYRETKFLYQQLEDILEKMNNSGRIKDQEFHDERNVHIDKWYKEHFELLKQHFNSYDYILQKYWEFLSTLKQHNFEKYVVLFDKKYCRINFAGEAIFRKDVEWSSSLQSGSRTLLTENCSD